MIKDVVIIGAGPVGLFAALALQKQGLSVDIYERWPSFYPLPRACGVDHEIIRLIQGLGLMETLEPLIDPLVGPGKTYEFRDTDFETLLKVDWNRNGRSGWAQMNMFYQPDFEQMMIKELKKSPRVRILHGHELVGLKQHLDHVELEFSQTEEPTARSFAKARYVIGADGARSTVRDLLDIPVIDLGFAYDWLVVDVIPNEERAWKPYVVQYCDPARPTTLVGSGPKRRRWEFMCLPGEDIDTLNTQDMTWKLLAPWDINPENATLERHTVYTFRGSWTDQWKKGRVFLAGDAAHLMPPFLGQGLCSGMRDAFALSWRLAAVVNGNASETLLESYGPERRDHVREIINQAVELGRLICMLDPEEVALRNASMKAALKDPALALKPPPEPRLGYAGGYQITDDHAGYLSVQGRVRHNGQEGFFDDVVGKGWQLIMRGGSRALVNRFKDEQITGQTLVIANFGNDEYVVDLEGSYQEWFDQLGADVVLVRPDLYIFGTSTREDIGGLISSAQTMTGSKIASLC
jgi:resorcinol 4-hydroxylase (NADPH)